MDDKILAVTKVLYKILNELGGSKDSIKMVEFINKNKEFTYEQIRDQLNIPSEQLKYGLIKLMKGHYILKREFNANNVVSVQDHYVVSPFFVGLGITSDTLKLHYEKLSKSSNDNNRSE